MTQLSNTTPPQIAEHDAPGLCLDSCDFVPAAQLQLTMVPPRTWRKYVDDARAVSQPIERRVHVTSEGVRFGDCFISHAVMLEGRGPITAAAYKKWLNLPG